jgi:anti-sigma-K factor RskA
MTTKKNNSLETFVERHRADFDVHEPRPDLWAALEQQLAAPAAAEPLAPAAPKPLAPVRAWWGQRYGMAAALAALVLAAGATEAWKSKNKPAEVALAAAPEALATDDAALYLGAPQALTAAERTGTVDSQLVRAVRGMETYYASQLSRRQAELNQQTGAAAAGMAADWQRELVSLDSSYRVLKQELPSHPQPEVLLTAMNRNLQIRLDILDQQLHLGVPRETDLTSGSYVLADSRHQSK